MNRKTLTGGVIALSIVLVLLAGLFAIGQKVFETASAEPVSIAAFKSESSLPKAQTTDLKIKGNKNSKIYHLPGCASYNKISPENIVWFKTHEEAKAAGYRMAKNC